MSADQERADALAERLAEATATGEDLKAMLAAAQVEMEEVLEREALSRAEEQGSDASTEDLPRIEQDDIEYIKTLGAGGFGIVKAANVPGLQSQVAVKLMRDEGDGELMEMEARMGAFLSHPDILAVHGLVVRSPVCGVVLELAPGGGFDDFVRECTQAGTPLVASELRQLFLGPCRALAYMHSEGVCHRDIKPENLLGDRRFRRDALPSLKLADFGIAAIMQEGQIRDSPGGTPGFWAPEVASYHTACVQYDEACAKGCADEITPPPMPIIDDKADVFSLGMTIWTATTGCEDPDKAIQEVLGETLENGACWEGSLALPLPEGTPAAWASLISACLQFDPSHRPSAVQVVEQLIRMEF